MIERVKSGEIKNFIVLCLPLAAAFLAQKGMQFIDTLMMGWIGPDALAAGALATNIFITILVFGRGAMNTVGVAIVHARGKTQEQLIPSILHQAFYLSIIIAIPAMLLAWQAPFYLTAMGQNPVVSANAQRLLHGLMWGIPGFLLFYVMREYISAFALARAIMIVSLISIPLTFGANYVLIYGKLGFPALGVAGIGYATAAVCWFMFFALLFYCARQHILKAHLSWRLSKPDFGLIKSLWVGGFPNGIIMVLDMVTFLAAALLTGYFGVAALAAYQIVMQCTSIAYNLPLAVSVVTALEAGHAYGSRNLPKIKRNIFLGIFTGLTISVLLSIFFISSPRLIVELFLPNSPYLNPVLNMAQSFLIIAGLVIIADGGQCIIIAALRGLGDTLTPMVMSVFCYLLIGLTSAYLLSFHTALRSVGVWYGLFLGIFSLWVFAGWRLWLKLKKLTF